MLSGGQDATNVFFASSGDYASYLSDQKQLKDVAKEQINLSDLAGIEFLDDDTPEWL